MTLRTIVKTALSAAALIVAPTLLSAGNVYPYPTAVNYCPAGLQPVTANGVICCGVPNRKVSYADVMRHPVTKTKVHKARRSHPERIPLQKGIPTGKGLGD